MSLVYRGARREDRKAVDLLLEEAQLEPLDPAHPVHNLVVALEDEQVVGAIGLVVHARTGVVRSLVVAPAHRGRGLARELMRSLLPRCYELSLRELFLLTTDAVELFEKLGFRAVGRDQAPIAIQESREFRACPESATLMRMGLA